MDCDLVLLTSTLRGGAEEEKLSEVKKDLEN